MLEDLVIHPERAAEKAAIHALLAAAFDSETEARLVDRLREEASPYIALTASIGDQVIGFVGLSPVAAVAADGDVIAALGLAPMAVLPAYQRRGVGGRLLRASLDAAAGSGHATVFVLGHPDYYPRFGFRRADVLGWRFLPGTESAFFVYGPAPPGSGIVRYHTAFDAVG